MNTPLRILFLCTGNSARSIIAEAILRARGGDRFRAFSAGSDPAGRIHPGALDVLDHAGLSTEGLYSKNQDEFRGDGAPPIDLVITVCDHAAESCAVLPGHPATVHWGLPDPAGAEGHAHEIRTAFEATFHALERRIHGMIELTVEALDIRSLCIRLDDIAHDCAAADHTTARGPRRRTN